jgi:small subunit ribosomal protein S2
MYMVNFLVPQEKYLEAGVHIGTKTKNGAMRQFIYKVREDGLHVLDLKKLDERIKVAAKFLASFDAQGVYVVGNKENAEKAVEKFAEILGFKALSGRFTPGKFTNPLREDFCEPQAVVIVDPSSDRQALKEAFEINKPILSLCDTNNSMRFIDYCVPTNNKGRKAIALIFWILAREVLKLKGTIKSDDEFMVTQEEFEA